MEPNVYIWSMEHNAWWGPRYLGYKEKKSEAGIYKLSEARKVVQEANRYRGDAPNEAIIFVDDLEAEWKDEPEA